MAVHPNHLHDRAPTVDMRRVLSIQLGARRGGMGQPGAVVGWLEDTARRRGGSQDAGDAWGAGRVRVWGVSALVQALSDTLNTRYGTVTVRGELSSFMLASSGHAYFTLKDESGQAALRGAMFRRAFSQVDFSPSDGMLVEVRGKLSVFEARGELQLVAEGMQRAGAGALFEQFLRLKARLSEEGLFEPERKRPIGGMPRRVGVVTSLAAAALHDVLTALRRRAPHVEVVIFPALVQGADAPAQIVQALLRAQSALPQSAALVDTIILCRGGGSLEDLWAFNDERVVRAVASSTVPVICGVGHETDVTLSDLAADLRAPTPTAAAELVALPRPDLLDVLDDLHDALSGAVHRQLDQHAMRLDHWSLRMSRPTQALQHARAQLMALGSRWKGAPSRQLMAATHALAPVDARLARASHTSVHMARQRLEGLSARLNALDPQRVLERGYAWVADASGQPVLSASVARVGQGIAIRLADGALLATVDEVMLAPTPAPEVR